MQISRESLYQAIWRTPMSKLASEWNVGVTTIIKSCEIMKVPRPTSSHWSYVRLGLVMEQPALPPPEATTPLTSEMKHAQKRGCTSTTESAKGKTIIVAKDINAAHPEVRKMQQALVSSYEHHGLLTGMRNYRTIRIKVSKAQLKRAVLIVDALGKALESRGAKFVAEKNFDHKELEIAGERIECLLIEETTRKELPQNENVPTWQFDRWKWETTGRLRFEIKEYCPRAGRKKWSDSEHHALESHLDEIVERLFVTAQALKEWAIEREEASRRWQEEARQREEVERRQALEMHYRTDLEQQAQLWVRATNLRGFIQSCEAQLRKENTSLPVVGWEMNWLAWARAHAEQIDPLKNGYLADQKRKRPELLGCELQAAKDTPPDQARM